MIIGQPSKVRVLAAYAAVYVIWGSTFLAIRYAIETIPPFLMMGVRSILAGSILLFWSRKSGTRVAREQWVPLVIVAVLFFVLGHGLLAWAQKSVASGLAAVLIASDPLWIALIESLVIKEFRLRSRQIIGLFIGFAGIVLLFLPGQVVRVDTVGAAMILLSAISWSIGAVYSRVANIPKVAKLASGIELILGGLFLVLIALLLGEFQNLHLSDVSLRSFLALSYLVIFGSVVTFTTYVWLLGVTSATRVATHTYVNPVIAVLLGWALAGEQFTLTMMIASVVILLSVYLVLEKVNSKAENC
jgi:drug/metabolite transporter (DMT)-like permease